MSIPPFACVSCLTVVLAVLFLASPAAAADYVQNLKESLRPEHRDLMQTWEEEARKILEALETAGQDKETLEHAAAMRSLLDQPRLPIPQAEELTGHWKVRSMQANKLGAYIYPYFKCRFFQEAQALVFHKNTGSQRRYGFLARDTESCFFFAGATYYDYESPRPYSTHMTAASETDHERDSVGHLYKLGKNRLMMVMAPEGGRFEIYELIR